MIKWSILCALFLAVFSSLASTQATNQTFVLPVDLVLVLDDSGSINDTDFEKMMNAVREFPNMFVMSEENVRIGVVVFATQPQILLNLTADANELRNLKTPERQKGWTRTDLGLQEVEKVLENARPKAHKAVLLLTDGEPTSNEKKNATDAAVLKQTEDAAEQLWKKGVSSFVGFVGDQYKTKPDLKKSIDEKIARDPSRVFPMEDFGKMKEMLSQFPKLLKCDFKQVCKFDKEEKCKTVWLRPFEGQEECFNDPPTVFQETCVFDDCAIHCEEWPWQEVKCDESNAGQTINVGREGEPPEKVVHRYWHCATMKPIECPMVSTPQLPSTPEEEPPTPEKPPTPEEPPTSDEPLTPDGPPTPDDPPAGETSTKEGAAGQKPNEENVKDENGMEDWVIIVIVVVAVLVLVLIIVVAVVITRRKKKKQREEAAKRAKERADAERAAMEKMKKSSAKGKKGMSSSSSMGALDYDPRGQGKKAEHSVLADLALDQSKKPSGRESKKSIKASSGSGAKKSIKAPSGSGAMKSIKTPSGSSAKKSIKAPSGSGSKESMPPQPKSKSVSKGPVVKKK